MSLLTLSKFLTSIALPLVMFPVIYYLQLKLGYEVALFPLYMIPVAKISWEFGWKGGGVAVGLACILWYMASLESGQPFRTEWIRFYNVGIRGSIFGLTGYFILIFRRTVEQHRRRMETMRALLNVCHGCGNVQGSDGKWISLISPESKVQKQSRECPSCADATQNYTPVV